MPLMPTARAKPRLLTGDQPTGRLHLGHWVGSLEARLAAQETHECYFILANIHALTTRSHEPKAVREDTLEIVRDYLAAGIEPKRSAIFLQSEVPAISELTIIFSMLVGFGRVMKLPTIKDEIRVKELGETYCFGFPLYAVGQIADILAFRPAVVPVGEDQKSIIEMTREVARRFNQLYCGVDPQTPDEEQETAGGLFPIPDAQIGRVARLTGTDGKNKMSKSLNNAIFLSDDAATVSKKCNKIYTGRGTMDEPPVLEGNTVLEYLQAFHPDGARVAELRKGYTQGEIGDGALKKELATALNDFLEPMRQRRDAIGEKEVLDALRQGTRQANTLAEETLMRAKEAMGYDFFKRKLEL